MLRTILVPLDGSAVADHALEIAAAIAQRADASVRLLHVRTPAAEGHARPGQTAGDAMVAYLAERARRLEALGIKTSTVIREGAAVSTIIDEAAASGADLIVLSKHGRTGPSAAWLGSVADGLARQADVPVLFVRAAPIPGSSPDAALIRRVLVPLDGSDDAEQVLAPAVAFARLTDATITLLVVDVLPILIGEYPLEIGTRIDTAEQWRRAEAYLETLAPRLRAQGVHVDVALRANQSAAAAILDEAARTGADLIALATHGRSRLRRLFIGSVADKVLRGTSLPVLLVRPRELPVTVPRGKTPRTGSEARPRAEKHDRTESGAAGPPR